MPASTSRAVRGWGSLLVPTRRARARWDPGLPRHPWVVRITPTLGRSPRNGGAASSSHGCNRRVDLLVSVGALRYVRQELVHADRGLQTVEMHVKVPRGIAAPRKDS